MDGSDAPIAAGGGDEDAPAFVARLRAGDESAWLGLVAAHRTAMLRVALLYCRRREAAEDAVQETWLAVFRGIATFEGRSALRTWIYSILLNRARTRGAREAKLVPLADLAGAECDGPLLGDDAFQGPDGLYPGHWAKPPVPWGFLAASEAPDRAILAREIREAVDAAIADLPPVQRAVMTLRDVEEIPSDDVRNALGLSETNVRVILHRARARVRRALEDRFGGDVRS